MENGSTKSVAARNKRIAVIAVHGVADQPAGATQQCMAGLLSHSPNAHCYSSFTERKVLANEEPVKLTQELQNTTDLEAIDALPATDEELEHESMREQLQGLKTPGRDTEIRILSASRSGHGAANPADVDIFEMHWADLSRIADSRFSLFFEFYLLLYFLPRLGAVALERLRPAGKPGYGLWRVATYSQRLSQFLLVQAMPVLHLCILSLGITAFPVLYHAHIESNQLSFSLTFLLLLLLIASIAVHRLFRYGRKYTEQLGEMYIAALLVLALVFALAVSLPLDLYSVTVVRHFLCVVVLLYLVSRYDKRQHGVLRLANVCFWLTFIILLLLMDQGVLLRTIELIEHLTPPVGALTVAVFILSTTVNLLCTFLLRWSAARDDSCMRKAFFTSNLTLIVPGLLAILVTYTIWEMIHQAAHFNYGDRDDTRIVPGMLKTLIDPHMLTNIVWVIAAIAASIGYAIWIISPTLLADKKSRESEYSTAATRDLGLLLSQGINKLGITVAGLAFVLCVMLPYGTLGRMFAADVNVPFHEHVMILGLAAVIFALLFVRGPLRKGFGAVLDIALDVTNWFRVLPAASNPKARICSRYVSLLRHIASGREADQSKPYDAVLIVAHSQGTVITADLLRFLQHEHTLHTRSNQHSPLDAGLQRYFDHDSPNPLPLHLVTMGTPLRQFYYPRFPNQYGWSGPHANTHHSITREVTISQGSDLPDYLDTGNDQLGPEPLAAGLASWRNLYFSGDYVGRNLWYPDNHPDRFNPDAEIVTCYSDNSSAASAVASEKCIGYGGHTRYWNCAEQVVAKELDSIIARLVS